MEETEAVMLEFDEGVVERPEELAVLEAEVEEELVADELEVVQKLGSQEQAGTSIKDTAAQSAGSVPLKTTSAVPLGKVQNLAPPSSNAGFSHTRLLLAKEKFVLIVPTTAETANGA